MELRNHRLLILENNPQKCKLLSENIESLGYTNIDTISDIEELKKDDIQPPKLIIIGSGKNKNLLKTIEMLKNHPKTKKACYILSTSIKEITFQKICAEAGVTSFIWNIADVENIKLALRSAQHTLDKAKPSDLLAILLNTPFFKYFTKEEAKTFLKGAFFRTYSAGETILKQGEVSRSLYILLKGSMEAIIFKEGFRPVSIPIAEQTPFGERAIFDSSPAHAHYLAAEDCIVLEMGAHLIKDNQDSFRIKVFERLAVFLAFRTEMLQKKLDKSLQSSSLFFQTFKKGLQKNPPKLPIKMEVDLDRLTLLIVDNNPSRREEVKKIVSRTGVLNIELLESIEELPNYSGDSPHLMMIASPEKKGKKSDQLLEMVDKYNLLKKIPKIFYFNNSPNKAIHEQFSGRCVLSITKPTSPSSLNRAISQALTMERALESLSKIKKSQFFEAFSEEEIRELQKSCYLRRFAPGEKITGSHKDSDSLYILLKGKVEMTVLHKKHQNVVVPIHEGNPFGILMIIGKRMDNAFSEAITSCFVLEIGPNILKDENSPIRQKIFAQIAVFLAERADFLQRSLEKKLYFSSRGIKEKLLEKSTSSSEKMNLPFVPSFAGFKRRYTDASIVAQVKEKDRLLSSSEEKTEELKEAPSTSLEEVFEMPEREYELIQRKIYLRLNFIQKFLPPNLIDMVSKKLHGYLIGGKLASVNPHRLWPRRLFLRGSHLLKNSLHLVVLCENGEQLFQKAFLNLPFIQAVVGHPKRGMAGSFLGSREAIERYLSDASLKSGFQMDMEIPIDRTRKKEGSDIHFLTHSTSDVREETLFFVFENEDGWITRSLREHFPRHQIITAVKGCGDPMPRAQSFFSSTALNLKGKELLTSKKEFEESTKGFYKGETVLLPDLSDYFKDNEILRNAGTLFGTMMMLSHLGPDYSGESWGSAGGAKGAMKAFKSRYGVGKVQDASSIASAVEWAST